MPELNLRALAQTWLGNTVTEDNKNIDTLLNRLRTGISSIASSGAITFAVAPVFSSGLTLTAPTIADFTNATHTHQNTAGGGTLDAAAIAAGTLAVARGGTGLSSGTSGGVLAYTATGTLASSAALAANGVVIGGGAGAVPATIATANNGVLITSAGGVPSISSTLPSAVQDLITRTGTLVAGATGAGFTVALGTSTITGILGGANGGSGNGFFAVSGPTTSLKTFAFPDASATVLTTNAAVTVAQGGTGAATLGEAGVLIGNGTDPVQVTGAGTVGQVLTSNGAGVDPTFQSSGAGANTFSTPTDPVAIAGTTFLMLGLAGAITPVKTGSVVFMICGTDETAGATAEGASWQIAYGTGTAPVNGAAATGTVVGVAQRSIADAATAVHVVPFSIAVRVTGLTLSTAYWFDLQLKEIGGAGPSANLADIHCVAFEV